MFNVRTYLYEKKIALKLFIKRRKMKIASLEETVRKIKEDGCSISRFGDGEFYIMESGSIGFQKSDGKLSDALKKVISSNEEKLLVCIGNALNPTNYKEFTEKAS